MSPSKPSNNLANPPVNSSWEEAQRSVRERNDQTRRAGNKERAENERRADEAKRLRDERAGVFH